MATIFTKGLDKDDEKEGFFKKLKNIENKSEEQLREIKNQNMGDFNVKDSRTVKFRSSLNYDAKHSFYKYRLSELNQMFRPNL